VRCEPAISPSRLLDLSITLDGGRLRLIDGIDEMIVPGAVLWWERAQDPKRALEVRVIGSHVDTTQGWGPAGFSAGGFSAHLADAARADPVHFVMCCLMTEADRDRASQEPDCSCASGCSYDASVAAVKTVFHYLLWRP
jgi:hypothetical protein